MRLDEMDPAKSAILFFDVLNGYFHGGENPMSEVKRRSDRLTKTQLTDSHNR